MRVPLTARLRSVPRQIVFAHEFVATPAASGAHTLSEGRPATMHLAPTAYADEARASLLLDPLSTAERDDWLAKLRQVAGTPTGLGVDDPASAVSSLARPIAAVELLLQRPTAASPLGISITTKSGKELVVDVEWGSPAAIGGVRPGDVLLAIGGEAVLSAPHAARLLRADADAADAADANGSSATDLPDLPRAAAPCTISLLVGRARSAQLSLTGDGVRSGDAGVGSASSATVAGAVASDGVGGGVGVGVGGGVGGSGSGSGSGSGLPARQQHASRIFEQIAKQAAVGVSETRAALAALQQRIRAERAVAAAYTSIDAGSGDGSGPAHALEAALGAPSAFGTLHALLLETLLREVEAPIAAQLRLAEQTLKASADLAANLTREVRAKHEALSRARTELHRRHLEAEGLTAEYHKSTASGGSRRSLSQAFAESIGRSSSSIGGRGGRTVAPGKLDATDRLSKLLQRLAVTNGRVAQAESVYWRERMLSEVSTWKYCTLEIPAICIQLKGVDAQRADVVAAAQWRALNALSELPTGLANVIEERTRQAASLKGQQWLDATL